MSDGSKYKRIIFENALAHFKRHESNGNWKSAHEMAIDALLALQAVAVQECNTPQEGIVFIQTQGGLELLDKCDEMGQRLPPEKRFMIFCALGVAHIASLMGRHEMAERYVARSQTPDCSFWDEYARAMQCLVTKQPYVPELEKVGKLTNAMKYWAVYLPFISDITHGRDCSSSLETMRQWFQKRQTDKRLANHDGGLILEGSARWPTHWDFRAEGLKAYASYKYGLTFPS